MFFIIYYNEGFETLLRRLFHHPFKSAKKVFLKDRILKRPCSLFTPRTVYQEDIFSVVQNNKTISNHEHVLC